MCEVKQRSKTKKRIPKCRYCHHSYIIDVLDPCLEGDGEDIMDYKYMISNPNTMCKYHLESYQYTVDKCVKSIYNHMDNLDKEARERRR